MTYRSGWLPERLTPAAAPARQERRVVVRELGDRVGELLLADRLSQRREDGPGVLERLCGRHALALGEPAHELIERQRPRGAVALLLAALEWRVQRLGELGREVVDLATGDPVGQRLEHRFGGAARRVAVHAGPTATRLMNSSAVMSGGRSGCSAGGGCAAASSGSKSLGSSDAMSLSSATLTVRASAANTARQLRGRSSDSPLEIRSPSVSSVACTARWASGGARSASRSTNARNSVTSCSCSSRRASRVVRNGCAAAAAVCSRRGR